ncbi:MAG: MerR family transcriptional regulator [Candidatus Riflebacteria bacterium]|nr:MerR family transcriptional regulator [Candidatus Riflebacteria bacterium]
MEKKYSIGELSEITLISRRAVRYYVQRGLLAPPEGGGRYHYYTDEHLKRLCLIKEKQADGMSLEEIISWLNCAPYQIEKRENEFPGPVLRTHYKILDGVELSIESGLYKLSESRLKHLRETIRTILSDSAKVIA